MDEITRLANRCNNVHITFNEHRVNYHSIIDELTCLGFLDDTDDEVLNKMVDSDTMVSVQFYPSTPIGFYVVHHHDLTAAVALAHKILDEE